MKKIVSLISALLFILHINAQSKKSVEAHPLIIPLTIDGKLDEAIYSTAQPAKDFVQLQPYNGKPSMQPTEAYFFFDQTAIYVGARHYDNHPDSIFNYMTERDNIGMSDYFGVYIDPYNQGQLAYGFFITPAGIQVDIKAVKNSDGDNEDSNWNAVWESKTRIDKNGWTVEMRIPYSALRFSDKTGDTWGLNMFRNIRRYNSNNSWNLVDRKVLGFLHQEGQLVGLKNIKAPLRLSLSPYIATYFEPKSSSNNSHFLYKGGLDLKYGINDAFTLDMMVIPDFGQIQSDDQKLNLTPYELYYDEKRQFFTEGTELFLRGGIFYSRRIGSSPKFSAENTLNSNEIIDYNPSETQLVNATKISGRTNKGWGLGMLNAMSLPSNAIVKNSDTGSSRDVLVQSFTNYNVAVIDKSLPNNSYISIINTNVSMVNNPFHANVTATEFQLRNKSMSIALNGKGGFSSRGDSINENGYYGSLRLEKTKGKFFFGASESVYSDKYNPNDMGYLQRNNQVKTETWMYYQILDPFLIFREFNGDMWYNYNRMYNPNTLYDNEVGYDLFFRFKNNYTLSSRGQINSTKFDYFETRTTGRYYLSPHSYNIYVYLNTDQRKNLSFSLQYELTSQPTTGLKSNTVGIDANLRIGNRVELDYGININSTKNERGYTDKTTVDSIIFANRNVSTLINTLSASYILSNKASLRLRARHYWSGVENSKFYLLQADGHLEDIFDYNQNMNQNYNAFTVDMILRWIFAPGSELSLAWKTASYTNENTVEHNYWNNFQKSWMDQSNSLSLKVLYYIDYNSLVKKK
jgi:hypothetical protein